jgi:predicted permease
VGGTLGNTSNIAFPLILLGLSLDQIQYFTWAVIFDLFSTTLSLYFIAIITSFVYKQNLTLYACLNPIKQLFFNKIFWSLIIGLFVSSLDLPIQSIDVINQTRVALIPMCLMAIGMQLKLPKARLKTNPLVKCLLVKMLIVPLIISAFILALNVKYLPILVILIQVSMPPLLIDNVIRKNYNSPQDFNLAANSIGCAILGFTIPILFILFS